MDPQVSWGCVCLTDAASKSAYQPPVRGCCKPAAVWTAPSREDIRRSVTGMRTAGTMRKEVLGTYAEPADRPNGRADDVQHARPARRAHARPELRPRVA